METIAQFNKDILQFYLTILFALLVSYLISSFSLYVIFKDVRVRVPFKSFIPVVSTLTKAKRARINSLYFTPCLIPIYGIIYYLVLVKIVNYKFTKAITRTSMFAVLSIFFAPFVFLTLAMKGEYYIPYMDNKLIFGRKINKRL